MSSVAYSLVTITLFAYKGKNKAWGFFQMGLMPAPLRKIPGLNFFQLLGSGSGNGFSAVPKFEIYGLLAVWQNHEAAENFFQNSEVYQQFTAHSATQFTVYLQPIHAKGVWNGLCPFNYTPVEVSPEQPVAVLTRATLRWQSLIPFWRITPQVSAEMTRQPGVRLAIGLGELPWIRQATFSIWESTTLMQAFAYHNTWHKQAMRKAREDNWFKEELFARFLVIEQRGQW